MPRARRRVTVSAMHPFKLTRRSALAPLLAACALGAAASTAEAEIVVYVDAGNEVWAENVDGTMRRQLTTDGDPQLPYAFPSMNDAGDIAAIRRNRVSNLDTRVVYQTAAGAAVSNIMPSWGSGVLTPLSAQIQPEGKLFAYAFSRADVWSTTIAGNVVQADAPGSPGGGPFPGGGQGIPDMVSATWHGGKLVWSDGSHLYYGYGAESTAWIPNGGPWGQVSRDARWLLARIGTAGGTRIAYQALTGPMPSQIDESVGGCFVPYTGTLGKIALSPSGQHVAFKDDNGLHVARVTLPPGTEETCLLEDRIISANGSDPSFSAHTYIDPNQRPPEHRGPDMRGPVLPPAPPDTRVPDTRAPGGREPGDGGGTRPRVAVPARSLRTALARGLSVRLTGLPKGRVTVRAKQGRRVVATGRATVPASGRASVRLRFTKAARKSLKGKRSVVLTIVAGKATAKVRLAR